MIQIPIKFKTELQDLKYDLESNPNCKCTYCRYINRRPWEDPTYKENKRISNQKKREYRIR